MLNFKTSSEPMDVGNEAITPHHNDPAIKELLDITYEIQKVIEKNGLISSDLDNPSKKARVNSLKELVSRFEKVVKKRFGIDVKIQIRIDKTFSFSSYSMPLPKSNKNVFYGDYVNEVIKEYDEKMNNNDREDIKKSHEIYRDKFGIRDSAFGYNVDEINAIYQNLVYMRDALNANGVTVDDDKVYISGLPDKYYAMLNMYFFQMVSKNLRLTPEEVLGIFLHELGHSYTFISYVYRSLNTCIIFDDSVKDYVRKNNGTPHEMVTYLYSKVTNGQKPSSKNTILVYNDLMKVISNPILPDGQYPANKNCEILADQFSARFGYGVYNVSGLNKVYEICGYRMNDTFANSFYEFRKYYENSIFHFLSLTIDEISNRNFFLRTVYYTLAVMVFAKALINDFFVTLPFNIFGALYDHSVSYEESIKRFDRIKKDIIRQIRIYGKDIGKEDINKLIDQINYIDGIVNNVNKLSSIPFVKFKNFVTSLYTSNLTKINKELYDIEILAEDLTENMLHIYKHKLKDV